MSLVDYNFIEEVFKRILLNLENDEQGRLFYSELCNLAGSIEGFRAFIVLGGSYQERMMTTRSDLDFWVMLYGETPFSVRKHRMNHLFKEAVVEPAFKEINSKYPRIRPCGSSVRIFYEFTERIFKKPKERWLRRISTGLKIITFGKVVDVDKWPFGRKIEYIVLRREFKEFWKRRGVDIWDVWKDLTYRLDRAIRNLKRRKGKSLYRALQLAVQQVSDAYGFPERTARSLSLEEKLLTWIGRPRYARTHFRDLCRIIERMRVEDLRGSQLGAEEFNRLKTQLSLFLENVYKPFRRFIKPLASMMNILEASGAGIRYFGIAKTHGYLVFSPASNPFAPVKGIDIERSGTKVLLLANLGRVRRDLGRLIEKRGYTIFHEERDEEGEVIHQLGFDGRKRTHVLLGEYDEESIEGESDTLTSDIVRKLDTLKRLIGY